MKTPQKTPPSYSEWLEVMLDEIDRKHRESEEDQAELARRGDSNAASDEE